MRRSYAYRYLGDRIALLRYHVRLYLNLSKKLPAFVDPARRDEAWGLQLALLREVRRLAAERGARMALVPVPEQVLVVPETSIPGLAPEDYQVQERLRRFAAAENIAYVDPLPALRAHWETTGERLYFPIDRHLTPTGHRVVAEVHPTPAVGRQPTCM